MAKFSLHIAIIFLMIAECISPRNQGIPWAESFNRRLLDIYYGTYPPDEHHLDRMKAEWARQLPEYSQKYARGLDKHLRDLTHFHWKEWMNHSATEREQLEEVLANIYIETNNGQPHHEKRMLEELFRIHPEYLGNFDLIRSIVYRWYRLYAPFDKEKNIKDVDWTPQRNADLLYIAKIVRGGKGELSSRIKMRWRQMYRHLNVNELSLLRYMYKLRKNENYKPSRKEELKAEEKYKRLLASEYDATQDGTSAHEVKRMIWTDEMNADLMYIDGMIRKKRGSLMRDMEDRWSRMNNNLSLSGQTLLARVHYLYGINYNPQSQHLRDAKERYDRLPPIPRKSKQGEKRKSEEEQIREGKQPIQQHQNDPTLPDFELTPERLAWLRRRTGEFDTLHTEHAHYPHQTYYYGGSSHTPSHQGSFGSPTDTPRPLHQWHPGGSNSSHTLIGQGLFGSLPDTPRPYFDQWYPGDGSSSTSRQPNIPNPHDHQWYPGSSSNHSQHSPQQ